MRRLHALRLKAWALGYLLALIQWITVTIHLLTLGLVRCRGAVCRWTARLRGRLWLIEEELWARRQRR